MTIIGPPTHPGKKRPAGPLPPSLPAGWPTCRPAGRKMTETRAGRRAGRLADLPAFFFVC